MVVNGTDAARVAEVEATITGQGRAALGVSGSVADLAVCEELVGRCVEAFGGIDLLVHNAGIVRDRTLLKMTPEEFDEVVAVHLRGAWGCARSAARAMARAGDGGHILNVTSGAGLYGAFGQSNYAAAKGGINGFTRALTVELATWGIRANALVARGLDRHEPDRDRSARRAQQGQRCGGRAACLPAGRGRRAARLLPRVR